MWYFIELYIASENIIARELKRLELVTIIAANGPYEQKYAEGVINDLFEDYDKITLMFKNKIRNKKEEETSFEDLNELVDLLN